MLDSTIQRRYIAPALLAVAMVLLAGCATHGWWDPTLDPSGSEFAERVDSERARGLIADLVRRGSADSRLATLTSPAISGDVGGNPRRPGWIPDQTWLRERADDVSMDFAALSFAQAISADERSRAVQVAFDQALREGAARSRQVLSERGRFP